MTCEEILEKLEQLSPSSFAMDWDNSGFLVGDRKKEVRRVLIAVDATKEVIQEAIPEAVIPATAAPEAVQETAAVMLLPTMTAVQEEMVLSAAC